MPRGLRDCPCGSGEKIWCRALNCAKCKTEAPTMLAPKRNGSSRAKSNGHNNGHASKVSIDFSESQLNAFIIALPLAVKAKLLLQALA